MIKFGYRAVEERFQPSQLLDFAVLAEKQGFEFVCISDHFHPWFHMGGRAGHAWVWVGAAGAKTSKVRLGTGVTTCLYRYHPAIVAQAFATLDELFPGRIFLGIGTGEAMNELPLGFRWVPFKERLEMTSEAIIVIKSLWEKDFVDFNGKYFQIRGANLYTKPRQKIPIYFAATGPKAAKAAGELGDALMMYDAESEHARRIIRIFEESSTNSGRTSKDAPKMVEMTVSYHEDFDKALESLSVWKSSCIPNIHSKPIGDPRELDRMAEEIDVNQLRAGVCTDIEQIIRKIEEYIEIGFNEIQVGSSSPNEEKFIADFGKKALPNLKEKYSRC